MLIRCYNREFGFSLARTFAGCLLLNRALHGEGASKIDFLTAIRWCNNPLKPLFVVRATSVEPLNNTAANDALIALDIGDDGQPNGCGDHCKFTGKLRSKM